MISIFDALFDISNQGRYRGDMEWVIFIIIIASAGRYGISGLTGGMALTAAGVALAVGINAGSAYIASIGGIVLLAAFAGGYAEARGYLNDHRSD